MEPPGVAPAPRRAPVVVLGEFDGFHLGHRHLVHEALRVASESGRPLVGVVLVPTAGPPALLPPQRRVWALMSAGVSVATVLEVESGDGDSVADELCRQLDPASVVVAGSPPRREPRYPALRRALRARQIQVIEVPRWRDPDGAVVTADRIRTAILEADIPAANDRLGRAFSLAGPVVHGSGLGRTLGFPTANLGLAEDLLLPKRGVYAATVQLPTGAVHASAVNIGVRPTVEHDGAPLLVEAHLLDFDADLYDQVITVSFRRWLRDEQRFTSVDELIEQLHRDVQLTRIVVRP